MNLLKHIPYCLLALLLIILIVATILEKIYGSWFSQQYIYSSSVFTGVWLLFSLSSLAYIIKRRVYKKSIVFLLHLSFIVILTGAFLTRLTGIDGSIHLRECSEYMAFIDNDGMGHKLPFTISLEKFSVKYYPNSNVPSDYQSDVILYDNTQHLNRTISMNNILSYKGYRFYQASYDDDERGTMLLVSYDPYGVVVTYTGYALLFVAMILFFFVPDTHFRRLLKSKTLQRTLVVVLLFFINNQSLSAHTFTSNTIYSSLPESKTIAILFLVIGLFSFLYCSNRLIKGVSVCKNISATLHLLAIASFVYISSVIALRWSMSGHIPLSNGFETMLFMSWCTLLITALVCRRYEIMLPFGFIISGLTLMVSSFSGADSPITPLAPVLSSPLLCVHVVLIMISYSLFAIMMLNGIMAMLMKCFSKKCHFEIERLYILSNIMLYPALFMLVAGIFIGAIWANISWGRYWGWDPKEVWALITMFIYSLAIHQQSMPCFKRQMFFHLFTIIAFLSVVITYFGVNFFLGGMHSYA